MFRRLALLMLVIVVASAACGDDEAATTTATPATTSTTAVTTTTAATATTTVPEGFPVEIDGVTIPLPPERIVSASATHTEILYAIGAGGEVIATDVYSDYPPEAEATEKIDSFNLNVEAVVGLDPDLVILVFDPGEAMDTFDALGIPALLFNAPTTLNDVYDQIATVGIATGHVDEAATVVAQMRAGIEDIIAGVDVPDEPLTYFHEVDSTLYTVTSSTFLGSLYALLGLENIADPADAAGSGYPQLGAEYILEANPDLIFLGDVAYGESAEAVAARPGWDALAAVQNDRIIELDSDLASRWSPRLVGFLASVAEALALVRAG